MEPISSGSVTLVEDCHALGIEVFVASAGQDERMVQDGVRKLAHTVITVDTNDEAALTEKVCRIHARHPLAAVLPGVEPYVGPAARIARRLGLRGLTEGTAERVRDKALMRASVARAGLRVPRFAEVSDTTELARAAQATGGFPCVLKPVDSCGSMHVSRVDDLGQLKDAYRRLREDERLDLGIPLGSRALVEEYVRGPEFSADGYVAADGSVVICSLTRKILGPEPHFVELGHIVPSDVPPDVMKRVKEYVQGVTEAVGITFGPFHCELRLPDGIPVMIEIAARLPGDHITDLVHIATGVSLSRVMLAAYLGHPPEMLGALGEPEAASAGIRYFVPGAEPEDGAGRSAFEDGEALSLHSAVRQTGLDAEPGVALQAPEDFRGRTGYALFTASDPSDALRIWKELGHLMRTGTGVGEGER
ncbi:ATP-grasp domain-containing protein [Streptomyces sp. SID7982]|nr:ATP-grasp domain-containing protein [Streptomyces sp. SID7982]